MLWASGWSASTRPDTSEVVEIPSNAVPSCENRCMQAVGGAVGQYRITRMIGQGGMGVVYAAEHTLLGRPAAVKVLLPEMSQNQDIVTRFFNEARAATSIRHPGIVEIYDFGWHA